MPTQNRIILDGTDALIAPVNDSIQPPSMTSAEQRLVLQNISWATYEQLLVAFGEHRAVRLHFDRGILELMVPLEAHERPSDLIGVLIHKRPSSNHVKVANERMINNHPFCGLTI